MINRRGFLKSLGLGVAVAVVQPKISLFLDTVGPSVELTGPVEISYLSMLEILKEFYTSGIEDLVYKKNPFLCMITKEDRFTGVYVKVPISYGLQE